MSNPQAPSTTSRSRATRRHALTGLCAAFLLSPAAPIFALNLQQLDPADIGTVDVIMRRLEPMITAKKQNGTANLLTWDALYKELTPDEQAFLDTMRKLRGSDLGSTSHYFGEAPATDLAPVGPEQITKDGQTKPLDPQYLPRPVLEAYQRMMAAMQADLGKRLLVESGYRSPAYQLYLFLFYMPKHGHSLIETNKFVALPGHSEHGNPKRQAIDFINQAGVNGEDHPEEFDSLPEYAWLTQRAKAFGFVLSYPKDNPYHTSYEPWHWHYEGG